MFSISPLLSIYLSIYLTFIYLTIYLQNEEEEKWRCGDCLSGVIVCTLCGFSEGETNKQGLLVNKVKEGKTTNFC